MLFTSYCGGDNPDCTDRAPCPDCLAMSNVFEVEFDGATFKRELAPGRPEASEWQSRLTKLITPLAGKRPLSRTRFNALARLAGASWLIGRRDGRPQG